MCVCVCEWFQDPSLDYPANDYKTSQRLGANQGDTEIKLNILAMVHRHTSTVGNAKGEDVSATVHNTSMDARCLRTPSLPRSWMQDA